MQPRLLTTLPRAVPTSAMCSVEPRRRIGRRPTAPTIRARNRIFQRRRGTTAAPARWCSPGLDKTSPDSFGANGFCTYAVAAAGRSQHSATRPISLPYAGSGGLSKVSARPAWQTGVPGIPQQGGRAVPDISMFAQRLYLEAGADHVRLGSGRYARRARLAIFPTLMISTPIMKAARPWSLLLLLGSWL